jgi:hypothetical protein
MANIVKTVQRKATIISYHSQRVKSKIPNNNTAVAQAKAFFSMSINAQFDIFDKSKETA